MTTSEIQGMLDFAVEACTEAGFIPMKYFQQNPEVEFKKDESPVTIADKQTEQFLRERIQKYYPDHRIVGEEFASAGSHPDFCWYLDPIDGTYAYVRGVPIFGVMMGLEWKGEFVVGVVNLPALNEIVAAGRGLGCRWNGRTATVSNTDTLENAVLCITGREYFSEGRMGVYRQLESVTAVQRTWGDCYGHVLVATGRADVCVDSVLHEWDAAALIPILQEAGGTFTDWKGKTTAFGNEGISTNGTLLSSILAITQLC